MANDELSLLSGIYAFSIKGEIIYIGKTGRTFRERLNEHKLEMPFGEQYLYQYLREQNPKEICFEILLATQWIKTEEEITNDRLEAMELAFITYYKPICNIQGVKTNYHFTSQQFGGQEVWIRESSTKKRKKK